MEEQWKRIKGYGNYLVSNKGRVFNYKFKKFLKRRKNQDGYLLVTLSKNGIVKTQKVHRLVAIAFIENPENKPTVNHIDGIKMNNFVSNLEWNTYSENTQHGYDIGLHKSVKGSKHYRAKLSEKEVLEIRRIFATGEYTKTALGEMFDVSQMLISYIVNRKRWTHI